MTMAIVLPEVVTAMAFAQRVAARNSVRSMSEISDCEWTLCHAFYLNMGGVWLEPRDSKPFPINALQLEYLIKREIIGSPGLVKKDIWDRSKADKFAKLFACMQIFWLAVQSSARGIQEIPVTPLEIATLGFMIPSLATFVLWFSKPVDIEVPTMLKIDISTQELLEKISPPNYSWRETPLDFIDRVNHPSFTSQMIIPNKWWPRRKRFLGPANRIRNDVFALKYTILDQVVVSSVWVGYAGTHFSAWNFSFPTRTELLLWRISCLIMSGSMLIFWATANRKFFLLFSYCTPWVKDKEKFRRVAYEQKKVSGIQIVGGAIEGLAYLFARLTLIGLGFSSLRSLPRDAYKTVEWTNFLPHLN